MQINKPPVKKAQQTKFITLKSKTWPKNKTDISPKKTYIWLTNI